MSAPMARHNRRPPSPSSSMTPLQSPTIVTRLIIVAIVTLSVWIVPPFVESTPTPAESFEVPDAVEDEAKAGRGAVDGPSTPQYMFDLYQKFASDRYSTPIANIIRSFTAVTADISPATSVDRIYELVFNISCVYHGEDVLLAELQLEPLLDLDRRLHDLHHQRHVTLYERVDLQSYRTIVDDVTIDNEADRNATKSDVTLVVTESIRRWAQLQATSTSATASGNHVFQVRISSKMDDRRRRRESSTTDDSSMLTSGDSLLVVFSNDRKRHKTEERELRELETRELESAVKMPSYSDLDLDDPDDGEDAADVDVEQADDTPNDDVILTDEALKQTDRRRRRDVTSAAQPTRAATTSSNSGRKRSRKHLIGNGPMRTRNACRRRPMYVKFADIHWDNWIIAPKGYQAYECVGQCYFPLNDHLTPTKYAIVKSLMQAVHGPGRSTPVCCVPTRLESISILYVDEQGTFTYKYRYDGMVVAECGCR